MTYVRFKHHELVMPKILSLIRGGMADIQKWNLKIRRLIKRIKNKNGSEADYLDLDEIITNLMSLYKEQRRFNQNSLLKQFARIETAGVA